MCERVCVSVCVHVCVCVYACQCLFGSPCYININFANFALILEDPFFRCSIGCMSLFFSFNQKCNNCFVVVAFVVVAVAFVVVVVVAITDVTDVAVVIVVVVASRITHH